MTGSHNGASRAPVKPATPVEFRGVSKRYPGSAKPALDDVSLQVPAGEICALVGPSGCGKTTAMRLVNRMVDISDGDILLDGHSVRRRKPSELRREIGYVIQQIGLFPHQTISENIATVPRLLGWDRKRTRERVAELLELVGLPDEMLERYPSELSGGQRQRVGVARALAADPPLMLMDEPFGAIDPITRTRLQDEFLRLQEEMRKTILFVTHDIDEAVKMGDRIAIFREGGRLVQYGVPEEVLGEPTDEWVASFVGADRGLKRLSLARLGELELVPPQRVPDGQEPPAHVEWDSVVFVDEAGRPVGRLDARGRRVPIGAAATAATSLRDALSLIMSDGNRSLVTVDQDGRLLGLAPIERIGAVLARADDEDVVAGEVSG